MALNVFKNTSPKSVRLLLFSFQKIIQITFSCYISYFSYSPYKLMGHYSKQDLSIHLSIYLSIHPPLPDILTTHTALLLIYIYIMSALIWT